MRNLDKYKGVIPAFYACYDKDGNISPEAVQALTKYFVEKGNAGFFKSDFFREKNAVHQLSKPGKAELFGLCRHGAVGNGVLFDASF